MNGKYVSKLAELSNRLGVPIDTEVDRRVRLSIHRVEGGRLLAARLTASALAGFQRAEEPLPQRTLGLCFECLNHCFQDLRADDRVDGNDGVRISTVPRPRPVS
jgi:hypothetical protein